MSFEGIEYSCVSRDSMYVPASTPMFSDSYHRSDISELAIDSFNHSRLNVCPTVRNAFTSAGAPSSSSSTSDPHVGPPFTLDVGREPAFGKKLNCQVLGRSTSRITGCEGKIWSAERNSHKQAQELSIRRCPGSLGYSEGSSAVKSETQQRTDGAYEQSECIAGAKDGRKSEEHSVETNTGTEGAYLRGEQGEEDHHSRAGEGDHEASLGAEAKEENFRHGAHHSEERRSKVSKPKLTSRMPPPSDCLQVNLKGAEFQVVGETLKRRGDRQIEVGSTKLGRTSRFGEGESVHQINENEEGSEKEPHLAERGSSHEIFGERLDVVVSRSDERSGVQLGLSGSWGENLSGSQEQLSFQGEDTVECITNVGEEDDFGFGVEDFHTPEAEKNGEKHVHRTDCPPELHARGELPQGGQGRHSIPGREHRENTLRARGAATLRSGESDLAIHQRLDVTRGGRTIPETPETDASGGGGRQEKDEGSERRLRKSEGSLLSGERRVRARLDGPVGGSGRGEATDDISKVVRPSRPSGGKDRHSKVNTAKGPRDRRVRLSVPTAVQFYDVQDRLGYDQPSKAVEWLIKKAKAAIDELGRLPSTGDEGPSALSDINQGSAFSNDLAGPLSGSSSCPPFPAISSVPFADQIGNPMSYFIDSSFQQGMAFGNINHQLHVRDVIGAGGMGLGPGHHGPSQGQLGGFCFPPGQADPSRNILGRGDLEGGKLGEFHGPPLARSESRVKARERARERAKEKCTGREGGKGDSSSPTSTQSPPLHQSQIHGSFPVQSALQGPIHSLSLQSPHSRPPQTSLSNVFNTTLSGIMQSPQQGTLQNLIMQSSSLQPSLTDQSQTSLQHPFLASLHSALKNSELQQQSQLPIPPLECSSQRTLHLGPGSSAGPCSSSFSDVPCLPSSDFTSISQSLPHHQLSAYGIPQPVSVGAHFPTGNTAAQIPPGFSPGPSASSFRPCPVPVGQASSPTDQEYMQAFSRSHCQPIVPSYSGSTAAPAIGSPVSKSSAPLYYTNSSSRMGNTQSTSSSIPHETAPFSSIRSMSYERDYQRGLQNLMMSPGRNSNSYESASSQMQMPARIQGLDDFEEGLKSPSPSSSHGRT